ncbi:MAG: hypothetical protein ACR2N8_04055 [Parvibaculales bacterium]
MNKLSYIICILFSLPLASCFLPPNIAGTVEFAQDMEALSVSRFLKKGKRTKEEVKAKLGQPKTIGKDKKGNELWTYEYSDSIKLGKVIPVTGISLEGIGKNKKNLFISFDDKGKVLKHYYKELKVGLFN